MFYSLDFIGFHCQVGELGVATGCCHLVARHDGLMLSSFKMIIIQSFEAMHAAEVLLLFPHPLGIDIPALQTCLHFRASLEQK